MPPELAFGDEDQPICEHCNGYGSSLKEDSEVCTVCNGTGLEPAPKEETLLLGP